MATISNWKVLGQNDISNIAPKQVFVNQAKPYETLVVASNNTNNAAINTTNAMYALAQYYESQGVATITYGLAAGSGNLNGATLTALGWTTEQCNPIIAWVQQGQINPVFYSQSKAFTASELDTLIRSSPFHDPALDTIPVMSTNALAMSKFSVQPETADSKQQQHHNMSSVSPTAAIDDESYFRIWMIIIVILIMTYQINRR